MLRNVIVPWNSLIRFTSSGIVVADYSQVRIAITNRFKEIYGADIDVSTSSADGIYLETLCLILNNILQAFKTFYSSLDVRTASGKFLEMLCALSNVSRKSATYSTASLNVTLDASEEALSTKEISFLDKNGNEWKATSVEPMIFEPGVQQTIIVQCTEPGPIRADAGWIDRTLELDVIMSVEQIDSAAIGSYAEVDGHLRARRSQSLGARGSSILESLAGALLSLTAIDDVLIYSNDTLADITANDGTTIKPHCVYLSIRKRPNITIADSLLGSIIYEKMTPGIMTTAATDNDNGIAKSFQYKQYLLGEVIQPDIVQNVCWKEAKPISPQIVITLNKTPFFASSDNATAKKIAFDVIKYADNIHIGEKMSVNEIKEVVKYADPMFRGKPTYEISSVTVNAATTDYNNPDTYFMYNENHTTFSTTGDVVTITIKA